MLDDPLLEARSCKGAKHYLLLTLQLVVLEECLEINNVRVLEIEINFKKFESSSKTDKNGIHR